jgi:GGDEF domain-containing protein
VLAELGTTVSFGLATMEAEELQSIQAGILQRRKSHQAGDATSEMTQALLASTGALELLIERADSAMYEAKVRGKDRVVVWGDDGQHRLRAA